MVPKELSEATQYVPVEYVIYTVIVLIAVVIVMIKFYPTLKKWFDTARIKVNSQENIIKTLEEHTSDINNINEQIKEINEKMNRDYTRINQLHKMTEKQQEYIDDSMEERELIVRSLLGIIQGLQELGANGPTKAAESDIKEYMVKKSHKVNRLNFDD